MASQHKPLSLLRFLLCIVILQTTTILHAQENEPVPAEQLYNEGCRLLIRGQKFERALLVLQKAVEQDKGKSEYVLAVGCAAASRSFVLSRALDATKEYPGKLKMYTNGMHLWRAGQRDETSVIYRADPPIAPNPPRTADDKQFFKMDVDTTKKRIRELTLLAWQSMDEGVRLRETDTPARRAEALNLKGWCRTLLWLGAHSSVPDSWPVKKPEPAQLIKPLEDAIALRPGDIRYLRSLGDACTTLGTDVDHGVFILRQKGIETLQNVLDIEPSDSILRLYLGELRGKRSLLGGKAGSETAIQIMKEAVHAEPNNAFVWYGLCGAMGDAHHYEEALAALEAGNAAPKFERVRYPILAPKLLGWAFPPHSINFKRQLIQAMHYLSFSAFADRENLGENATRLEHDFLVLAHRYNQVCKRSDIGDDERRLLESERFWTSYYTRCADLWKNGFPGTAEDMALLKEAQETIRQNDAAVDAEKAMGTVLLN